VCTRFVNLLWAVAGLLWVGYALKTAPRLSAAQEGTDADDIQFSVWFDKRIWNTPLAKGRVTVKKGQPARMVVVVEEGVTLEDAPEEKRPFVWSPSGPRYGLELMAQLQARSRAAPPEHAATNWFPFDRDREITVNLGNKPGWRWVWFGVCGEARSAETNWHGLELLYDTEPPRLVIREPLPGVVSVPTLLIRGYSPEPIEKLRYDLVNNEFVIKDRPDHDRDPDFDGSEIGRDAQGFRILDVPLAEGTNWFTLKAEDQAGNLCQTSLVYVLDISGDTSPPAATVTWPQDGANVAAVKTTVRGRVDDITAQVTCDVVSGSGTNTCRGAVDRDGHYWVEDVPLAPGTNRLFLTFRDYAWNESYTNLQVMRHDDVRVRMDKVPDRALMWPKCTVTGTISDSAWAVWVNGVPATVFPDGTWRAEDVPVMEEESVVFYLSTYPPGSHPPLPDPTTNTAPSRVRK